MVRDENMLPQDCNRLDRRFVDCTTLGTVFRRRQGRGCNTVAAVVLRSVSSHAVDLSSVAKIERLELLLL